MKFYQIERRIKIAIEMLRVNDNYLLKNDINERSITHKLSMYLDQTFGNMYDVDCEFNRDVNNITGSKKIIYYERELEDGWNSFSQSSMNEQDRVEKSVYPDIIIHKRGKNVANLMAVEVKKSTSRVNEEYDFLKLKCYTRLDDYNSLNYKYGVFIKFFTKQKNYKEPQIIYFEKGIKYNAE